jgi:dipeptidyl aminopeptidase/acylaminoacyl peptidase
MRSCARTLIGILTLTAALCGSQAQAKSPFTIQDLVRVKRLSDPRAAPDGRSVVFVLRETDMAANRGRTDLWLLDLATHSTRRLTRSGGESSPRWAPDGSALYFLSSRSGSAQVWRLPMHGGEALPVTSYPLEVRAFKVSPAGDRLVVAMDVLPGCADLQCTHAKLDKSGKDKPSGQLYDRLFIRHWDSWSDGTRSHLFSVHLRPDGSAEAPVDLARKLDADVPSKPFGDDADMSFSPDGRTIVFSARAAGRTEAWSTNFDLYEVASDGSSEPRDLTADNPAWDAQPNFLANGDLAYLAMDRPGFEADRFHIVVRDARTGKKRTLAADWDRSVTRLQTTADQRQLLATADDVGQVALYVIDPRGGAPRRIVSTGDVTAFASTERSVVLAWSSLGSPPDLYSVGLAGGAPQRLTALNADLLDERTLSEYEQFSFAGWNGETVHGYVMKPYGFEPAKRFPIAFIIHGGPQSSMANNWSYRWNPQVFAAAGYAVVFVDFHGSPGYGQAFTDSISKDWGGKPLEDLQKGLAAAIARYPWLDGERACALGASYGGYMINWIAGRWSDRFRCLVDHDGVFDLRGMYYSTEELWFNEWEFGGPYYEVPQNHERFNPVNHVAEWRTPMLVIHGGQDFRVPLAQGIGTFTTLQRRGIESRFLYFPDENHWVLKPANSIEWYDAVIGWLDAHLK